MAESQNPRVEWWSAFPAPRAKCPRISVGDIMKLFDDMDVKPGPRQFLLVDVRKIDWEVRDHDLSNERCLRRDPFTYVVHWIQIILTYEGWNYHYLSEYSRPELLPVPEDFTRLV
jgi:hypothetical protein